MSDPIARLNAALEGRYTIERELGEGGMANVYLADDIKHERKVALKVLKPELAAVVGAERFLTEIKTTANLQHPHILPLFDSGEADTFLFYVRPYVEGETLQLRIDREKQLPVDEALGIATAIANALQTAHDHGVVHRDIKPANILLSRGEPLVADFGIALAVGAAGGSRLTATGLSVGTPFYMSPEQATGDQLLGPASDTYALACVLYEMLVGEPPYLGNTAQAVLGKIIQGIPVSASAVRKAVPANVDAAIRKALEKLPADRFTGAQEFAKALADQSFRHGDEEVLGVVAAKWNRLAKGFAASTGVLAAALAWMLFTPEPEIPQLVERFAVPFLQGQEPVFTGSAGYDLSPDGTMLVYRHLVDANQILMVRRWDDLTATQVRETDGAANPAISLDGLELAFEQAGEIKVLALSGGPVRTVVSGSSPEWGPNGFVYATADSGAVRVPATGGAVEYVSRLNDGDL
jgi:serine/threonine-protein kinase